MVPRILEYGLQRFHDLRHRQLVLVQRDRAAVVCVCAFLSEGPQYVEPQPADGRPPGALGAGGCVGAADATPVSNAPGFHAVAGSTPLPRRCGQPRRSHPRRQGRCDPAEPRPDVLEEELLCSRPIRKSRSFVFMDVGKMFRSTSVRVKAPMARTSRVPYTPGRVQVALHRGGAAATLCRQPEAGTHELCGVSSPARARMTATTSAARRSRSKRAPDPKVIELQIKDSTQVAAGVRGQGLAVTAGGASHEETVSTLDAESLRWWLRSRARPRPCTRRRRATPGRQGRRSFDLDGHVQLGELVALARQQARRCRPASSPRTTATACSTSSRAATSRRSPG